MATAKKIVMAAAGVSTGAAADPFTTSALPVTDGLTARIDAKYWANLGYTSGSNTTKIYSYIVDTTTFPNGGWVTNTNMANGSAQTFSGESLPYFHFGTGTISNTQKPPILMLDAWSNATNATYGHSNGDVSLFFAVRGSGPSTTTGFTRFHRVVGSGGSSLASQAWNTSSQQFYSHTSYRYLGTSGVFTPLMHHAGPSTGRYSTNTLSTANIFNAGTKSVFSLSTDRVSSTTATLRYGYTTTGSIVRNTSGGTAGTVGSAPHTTGFTAGSQTNINAAARFIVILNDNLYQNDLFFHIGEVAVYNKYLSNTDHDLVMGHLATKWL